MNFNAPLLRPVRILLFPFSLLFGAAVWVRNILYDHSIFTTSSFNLPIIGVGNLSSGGTGKSPMVVFLVSRLKAQYKLAILSRGYKRKTTGYALARETSTALEIGDEPMLFHNKFPDVAVAVGEERVVAIPQLLHDRPDTQVIILDDSFQHRSVDPGLNILLTDYNNLFTRDWFLPTGDLRDLISSYKRADILVVTKCKPDLDETEKDEIISELKPTENQHIFFSSIQYGRPYHILDYKEIDIDATSEVLLVTGIANPRPLKKYLSENADTYYEILFDDHHIFTIDDWKEIRKRFDAIQSQKKIIITTEKDAVRLMKFGESLASYPVYVLPIETDFLFAGEKPFTELITKFITTFRHSNKN
jgi:tetraacyldisaccharide 4'-kinase